MKTQLKIVSALILCIFILQGCSNENNISEKSKKDQIDFNHFRINVLTKSGEGNFIKPKFTLSDKSVAFLSADLSGLWIKRIGKGNLSQIYSGENKIIDYIFTGKYDSVFIAEKNFEPNAKVKSQLLFLANGSIKQIYSSGKSISSLSLSAKNNLIFFDGNEIRFFNTNSFTPADKLADKYSSVFIDTTSLSIYTNGKTDKINLTNHQNVVWVSPIAEDSLLIYSAEDKLILISLTLKDIKKLGDYTLPVYNKIYRKIAVLKQNDDGLKEISSDIYLLNLRNMMIKNLTETPKEIESNINWSHNGKKLAFDAAGQIKFIEFGQNKPITK